MKYGSAVIITNSKGEIFLQHRDGGAPTDKNTWALWGGGKEGNESNEETAVRELEEELSIVVKKEELTLYKKYILDYVDRQGEKQSKEVSVFVLEDRGLFNYVLKEGNDMKFFGREEIAMLPLAKYPKIWLYDYCHIA